VDGLIEVQLRSVVVYASYSTGCYRTEVKEQGIADGHDDLTGAFGHVISGKQQVCMLSSTGETALGFLPRMEP